MSDDHIAALARIAHDATCSHRGGHEDCRVDGWWSDIFRAVLSPEHVPTVIAALVEAGVLGKGGGGRVCRGPRVHRVVPVGRIGPLRDRLGDHFMTRTTRGDAVMIRRPPAVVLAEVEHLLSFGESPDYIARSLSLKPGSVARALQRAGEPELARMFDATRRATESHPCIDCGHVVREKTAPRCRRCGCLERERQRRAA